MRARREQPSWRSGLPFALAGAFSMVVLSDTTGAGIYAVPFLAAFVSRVATGRSDVALAAGVLSILLLPVALVTVVVGAYGLDAFLR